MWPGRSGEVLESYAVEELPVKFVGVGRFFDVTLYIEYPPNVVAAELLK